MAFFRFSPAQEWAEHCLLTKKLGLLSYNLKFMDKSYKKHFFFKTSCLNIKYFLSIFILIVVSMLFRAREYIREYIY
jgi:hypothetical protein